MNTASSHSSFSLSRSLLNSDSLSTQDLGPLLESVGEVQNRLQQFFSSSSALEQLDNIFAINNHENAETLITRGALGEIELPQIQVLSNKAMNGAWGAYSSERNTIFLARSLVESDPLTGELGGVLLEEVGHYIDTLLNPGGDTSGDEGELFSNIVLDQSMSDAELIRIQTEDDFGTIFVNHQAITVEQDDTLGTAQNVGTLSGSRQLRGSISTTDVNDYYRFNLSQGGNFNLTLSGMSGGNGDVQLLNSAGQVLQTSSNTPYNPSESITRNLNAGTYYVRVYLNGGGSTAYTLTLNATSSPTPIDLAGNTWNTARNIGTLSGRRSFQDFVGSSDTNDFYRFNITRSCGFNLLLNGLSADADVQLLNGSRQVIQSSSAIGTSAESISRQLAAGTYYIRVYPYSGNTNYTLTLTSDYAGNTMNTACNIGALNGSQTFQDFVGSSDTNDFYRFNVTRSSAFSLLLNDLSADADVQLISSSGQIIQSSVATGTSSESISRQLNAGTYYVRVYPYDGNTNYQLRVTATCGCTP